MALYQEHRPTTFDDILGNKGTVQSLQEMLSRPPDKRPRAFLFEGPSGCGKTTLARIVAAELNGEFMEVDSADFRGIDFIRDLRKRMGARALSGKAFRVYLLDECHQLSKDAQTALLKTLEDTPKHVVVMLATTDPQKLLPTIRNRCTRFEVEPLGARDLYRLMTRTCKAEDVQLPGKEVLTKLAEGAKGSPRAALTSLDKVMGLDEDAQLEVAERFEKAETEAIELCRALIGMKDWGTVAPILRSLKETSDAEGVRRMVLGYCTSILMKKKDARAYLVADCFREHTYDIGWPGIVLSCWDVLVGE